MTISFSCVQVTHLIIVEETSLIVKKNTFQQIKPKNRSLFSPNDQATLQPFAIKDFKVLSAPNWRYSDMLLNTIKTLLAIAFQRESTYS